MVTTGEAFESYFVGHRGGAWVTIGPGLGHFFKIPKKKNGGSWCGRELQMLRVMIFVDFFWLFDCFVCLKHVIMLSYVDFFETWYLKKNMPWLVCFGCSFLMFLWTKIGIFDHDPIKLMACTFTFADCLPAASTNCSPQKVISLGFFPQLFPDTQCMVCLPAFTLKTTNM